PVQVDRVRRCGVEVTERVIGQRCQAHDGVIAAELCRVGVPDVAWLQRPRVLRGRAKIASFVQPEVHPVDFVTGIAEEGDENSPDVAAVPCTQASHRLPPSHLSSRTKGSSTAPANQRIYQARSVIQARPTGRPRTCLRGRPGIEVARQMAVAERSASVLVNTSMASGGGGPNSRTTVCSSKASPVLTLWKSRMAVPVQRTSTSGAPRPSYRSLVSTVRKSTL